MLTLPVTSWARRHSSDPRVMVAMTKVPRHRFVPAQLALHAYQDMPLPIGFDKTTSQPFIVALMTDLLSPQPHETVLEIGTGLGYQAAILAELAARVWSVEIVEEFAAAAEVRLRRLGYAQTSASASGTGPVAGPSTLPLTRSWWRPRPSGSRRPFWSSSSLEGAW